MSVHCRIKRVRLKTGGVIEPLTPARKDDAQRKIIDHAITIAGNFKPGEMVGHFVVGWDKDGHYSHGYHNPDECVIGRTLLPGWVGDILRRSLIRDGDWD